MNIYIRSYSPKHRHYRRFDVTWFLLCKTMKFIYLLLLFALKASWSDAGCPNSCSGHGDCDIFSRLVVIILMTF